MNLLAWFHSARASAKQREYDEGYDYSAGSLLRGADEHELIVDFCYTLRPTDFDRGGLQAMRDFYARGMVNNIALPLLLDEVTT